MSDGAIESWSPMLEPDVMIVRLRLGSETYTRRLCLWNDADERDRRIAAHYYAHAARIDASERVSPEARAAVRSVDHALAIEAIFPELHHDSRLPA